MEDRMLSELYKLVFEEKHKVEFLNSKSGEINDRLLQVSLAKKQLLLKLISFRTDQLRNGEV